MHATVPSCFCIQGKLDDLQRSGMLDLLGEHLLVLRSAHDCLRYRNLPRAGLARVRRCEDLFHLFERPAFRLDEEEVDDEGFQAIPNDEAERERHECVERGK
jgi:hypothetical protein